MKTRFLTFSILSLLLFTNLNANEKYWQQFVHYKMDVMLLPVEHALTGTETIEYKNNSPDTLRKFFLYLYPNAYRNNNTIYTSEARKYYRKILPSMKDAGYIEIESFRIINSDSSGQEKSLSAFQVNDTILEAELPDPLPPGGELKVELSFYLKIRKFNRRAGYRESQYDFAQWYPKVCVYDETGWNAEPFHNLGEFYGEFGTFDVNIQVPFEYIVGATGEVVEGDPGWDLVKVDTSLTKAQWREQLKKTKAEIRKQSEEGDLRTVKFHAENVHDFAWITCPDFLYESGEWDGIPIHVLYRSRVKSRWSKTALERSARALEWLSEKFGRYPYPQLTVTHGLLRGGMEYPMLVMNSSESEGLILHEVGHIYFYGILGNNEWKEAWLDEGFTSFQTRWYMETRYGSQGFDRRERLKRSTWLQKRRPARTSREANRARALSYMNSGHNEPISKPAYTYKEPAGYSINAYTKGAFFFDMLKHVVGDDIFEEICHEYFERWKFKHVNRARFQQVCEDVSGMKLGWFFEQWLDKSLTVDYSLGKVEKRQVDSLWQTDVSIIKEEKGTMPVDVQLTTQSGDTLIKRWNGVEKVGKVTFKTSGKPDKVILDPKDAILDNSRFNNSPLKTKVLFEYPNMTFRPRDAFLITWRPSGWYNKVDKLRIGGRIKGWQGTQKNAEVGLWFGTNSHELDYRFRHSRQIKPLGGRTQGSFMLQKMEGRFEIDAHLSLVKSENLTLPPMHRIWVGFNHSRQLSGERELYSLREFNGTAIATWQTGIVNKAYLRYSVNPRGLNWFSNITLGLDTVQEDWGSDFTYNAVSTELKFWFPKTPEGLFLRFYAKKIFDSADTPVQDLIFLDGANPRERFKHFYLRSDGGLPDGLHYHLPGGGNLRGFFNQPIIGDEILAINAEVRKQLKPKLSWQVLNSLLRRISVAGFADIAAFSLINSTEDIFADAGFGIRLQTRLPDNWYTIFTGGRNLTIRLDFPIWVSKSSPDENNLQFRWVFGFEQAL
ncbi:M1 family metallopeptidase [candidate division KSB1 bacterium]|nr:M1 family metallopeptidase [candidate division KSB1 bacterium]